MDDSFKPEELLYRAVYPPEIVSMFWRKDGKVSSAAFADPKGLSVDRGDFREEMIVIETMRKRFTGSIIRFRAKDCYEVEAILCYFPSKNNPYHSEVHGSENRVLLSKSQRHYLSCRSVIVG